MQIGSIANASYVSQVSATQTSSAQGTQTTEGVGSAASVNVSKPAELMAKLQQLKDSDPEKLKSVLSDISKQLQDTATQNGDEHLAKLAEKFASAAESGDLSGLAPHHGGGHHHGGPRGAGGPPPSGGPPPGAGQGGRTSRSDIDAILSKAIDSIDSALGASSSTTTAVAAG